MTQKKSQPKNSSKYAVCYYRSSLYLQSEAVIEQQREAAREWAETNGYEILREYQDVEKPGTAADRSGYERMLAEVSTLRPSVLLLWKGDTPVTWSTPPSKS